MSEIPAAIKPIFARQRIEIAISVMLVAVYLVVPFAILPRVCPPEHVPQPVPYQLIINGQQTQTYSEGNHKRSVKPPIASLESKISANGSAQPIYQPTEAPHEWRIKFWCETNASDFFVGLFTLLLGIATYFLWRETERLAKGADDQSEKIERSIGEAARAAKAMEDVASAMTTQVANSATLIANQKDFWNKQMRAYLSVEVGQMRVQDQTHKIRFEIDLGIANTGLTPAHNVSIRFMAEVLPFPLPDDLDLTVPEPPKVTGVINPRQILGTTVVAVALYPEEIVWETIIITSPIKLYVHGTVWYDDVNGGHHHTNFCQWALWKDAGNRTFTNAPRHNDSD